MNIKLPGKVNKEEIVERTKFMCARLIFYRQRLRLGLFDTKRTSSLSGRE